MQRQKSANHRLAVTLCGLAAVLAGTGAAVSADPPPAPPPGLEPMAEGKFQPSYESLKQYHCPDWFRDAKFGIWAHWTAQCVPEHGDWYARKMYIQGDHDYEYQVSHYGHPSKVGFKDIDHLWHAEHWDPEKLITLYQRAGAQYFVALANHHDNFDCWDSKYQPWNSVNLGPHKDIVGTWEKIARAHGMHFGVTVHASHAWSWFEVAQGSDKTGPLAGVPYDGKLTKADGKGTWWEGYDPQDLYAQNHTPGKKLVWDWKASEGSSIPDEAYCNKFYNRTIDLINRYHPDLLYFDDTKLPLDGVSDVGLKIAAHYYNSNMQQHDGKLEAVLNTKGLPPDLRKTMVWDIERGRTDVIEPDPWQTDTCIGQWHYSLEVFQHHKYKSAQTVITTLCDIVSKNGNLLLNVPLKGDGTIDDDELKFLNDMAPWMDVNREAIFGTRPWVVFGEGPSTETKPATNAKGTNFNEGKMAPYSAEDLRFTTKGDVLYAIALGWPDSGKLTIKSLAAGSPHYKGEIASVELLGNEGNLRFARSADGLEITMPEKKPCDYAFALRIKPANDPAKP